MYVNGWLPCSGASGQALSENPYDGTPNPSKTHLNGRRRVRSPIVQDCCGAFFDKA
jgi:hypothetical protein